MEEEVLAPMVVEANTLPNHEAKVAMVVEANTLPNHETKVAMVAPAAAVDMAVAEGFNYCQETKLSRRGEPEK